VKSSANFVLYLTYLNVDGENIALQGTASQSTTKSNGRIASKANDGSLSQDGTFNCATTDLEYGPWWQLSLGNVLKQVTQIKVRIFQYWVP
jgi:hypothetical protein